MTWNPFNWTAEPFLILYSTLAALVFFLGFGFRSVIGPPAHSSDQLNVLELALLAGGEYRLGDAGLLSLISANSAVITPAGDKIVVSEQTPLETLARRPIFLSFQPEMTRQEFQKAIAPLIEAVKKRLQQLGYSPTDDQMNSFRLAAMPFVGFLLIFGAIKVWVGIERHHPVMILTLLLVFTISGAIGMAKRPARTLAGKEALQTYQNSNARAARAPMNHELLLAVALSGAVVLSGTDYASVYAASRTMNSSGDGGSGCGGGGGGCGGCS